MSMSLEMRSIEEVCSVAWLHEQNMFQLSKLTTIPRGVQW
jgi:hypothetical protein